MKLFIIFNYQCYNDITRLYRTLEDAKAHYDSKTVIVEAPDYVFENWGYDETKEGNARFIQPEPPEGWIYDPDTGTFYPHYSNSEKRQQCYETGTVIKEDVDFRVEWQGKKYTTDALTALGARYEFRGETETANEIKVIVEAGVAAIRAAYPDENETSEVSAE